MKVHEEKKTLIKVSSAFKQAMFLFEFTKPYRVYFYFGFIFLILSSITVLTFPYLVPGFVDLAEKKPFEILGGSGKTPLLIINDKMVLIKFLILNIVLQAIFSFFRVFTFSQVTERTLKDIRSRLYEKFITLPYEFHEKTRIGELTSRISNDIGIIQDSLSLTFAEFIRQILTFIGGVVIVVFISKTLTGLTLVTLPPLVLIAIFLGKYIKNNAKRTTQAVADANVIVEESLTAFHSVKAYANEYFESMRYGNKVNNVMKIALKAAIFRSGFISFLIFSLFGILIFLLWSASNLVETTGSNHLDVSQLLQFAMYAIFIGGSIAGLGETYSRITHTLGATERLSEILNLESETQIREILADKFKGAVRFNQVVFSYPTREDITVLKKMSFDIQPGEKVALVGPSGAGKSTIIQLLLRFYDVNSGQILIDNKDSTTLPIQDLRANMALVPQEVVLFGGTIYENIAYGKLHADRDEILAAAKKANAYNFIMKFPEGFDTIVGERGIKLSGGQRQRIAIARAILRDPAILLLDEATSSLDAESEKLVQDALDKLMENRTTIIIAHRLSTIRNVDRILVIENGNIIESGSHEQLSLKENGLYNNLLKLQFQLN